MALDFGNLFVVLRYDKFHRDDRISTGTSPLSTSTAVALVLSIVGLIKNILHSNMVYNNCLSRKVSKTSMLYKLHNMNFSLTSMSVAI